MSFPSLIQHLICKPARNQQGRSRRNNAPPRREKPRASYVPRLECLEDRAVPSYVFHTIDDPSGVNGSNAFGINSRGQIVGNYTDASLNTHGFLLNHGQYTTIDDPNTTGGFSEANGINARGQIVGDYLDSNSVSHGYLLSGGRFTTIDEPNAGTGLFQGTFAFGINARGQIVGEYIDANNAFHGYLLSGGRFTTI